MTQNKIPHTNYGTEQYLNELLIKLDIKIKKLESLSRKYSNYRLFFFLFSLVVLGFIHHFSTWIVLLNVLVLAVVIFLITAHFHNKVDRARERMKVWKGIKSKHLAKIKLDWENIPETFGSEPGADPIEIDLNLTGKQSLHSLINIAASKQGKELLRKYLLVKEPVYNDVIERQSLVKELIRLTRFRDKLQLLSSYPSKKELDGSAISAWVQTPDKSGNNRKYFLLLSIIAPVNILLFILSFYLGLLPIWPVTLFVYTAIYILGNKKKDKLAAEYDFVSEELGKFSSILEFIERYPYPNNSGIRRLCACYIDVEISPGKIMKKIASGNNVLKIKHGNPLVWMMIRLFFPIDFYYNYKLEEYKKQISVHFESWLETWYKLEALNSLANFAWLNPDYNFPAFKLDNIPGLAGRQLGHPLIHESQKITNDFSISGTVTISLITGSNMSGKSTFLRTLGVNLCLAYAGAPVNAASFECSLLRVFTCIKVSDSVVDGISYFYAEVKRLKALLNEAEKQNDLTLFFLIDEIFRGTNNIERLKGSTAFINALASLKVIGALATHDLELVKLESKVKGLKNYHFKEQIKDDKMTFDYKIQPGPCPTTNALKIMKIEGLPTGE